MMRWMMAALLVASMPASAQRIDRARATRDIQAAIAPRQAIEAALQDSAAGWTAGDLDRFMAIYEDAPGTTFVTAHALLSGRAAIAAHYAPFFTGDHKGDRGALTFETLSFRQIDPSHAFFIGTYHVAATPSHPKEWTGPTSLLFARTPQGWKIVADHSS